MVAIQMQTWVALHAMGDACPAHTGWLKESLSMIKYYRVKTDFPSQAIYPAASAYDMACNL